MKLSLLRNNTLDTIPERESEYVNSPFRVAEDAKSPEKVFDRMKTSVLLYDDKPFVVMRPSDLDS